MHNKHTTSSRNKDLDDGRNLDYYMGLSEGWHDPLPEPHCEAWPTGTGPVINVVREDLVCGKKRFGDLLVQTAVSNGCRELVYVAPRFGHAGMALAMLAKTYDIKVTLFMPGCEVISDNQARALELGAEPVFHRIAAMPNLNARAKAYAEASKKRFFIPLGLKHELVTAAAVRTARRVSDRYGFPQQVWTAMSTGVLSRALQIAWPKAEFHAVAVARNIHDGEKGHATMWSHAKAFAQKASIRPGFPCASNYDAKCWEFITQQARSNAWFWNVAGDESVHDSKYYRVDSQCAWGSEPKFMPHNWRQKL